MSYEIKHMKVWLENYLNQNKAIDRQGCEIKSDDNKIKTDKDEQDNYFKKEWFDLKRGPREN